MKKIVGLGDLVLDVYHKCTSEVLGYYLGGSVWNVLLNIKKLDYSNECFVIGTCGTDESTPYIVDSFVNKGINIDYLSFVPKPVKKYHIIIDSSKSVSQAECPICKNRSKYLTKKYPHSIPDAFKNIDGDKYIIIDSLRQDYLNLASSFSSFGWKTVIDIGYISHLRYLGKRKIGELLSHPFYYIQTHPNVCTFLIKKLGISSIEELIDRINVKYLCVTDGEKGSTFYWKNDNGIIQSRYCGAVKEENIVDTTGAGDAFFSKILYHMNEDDSFVEDIDSILSDASRYAGKIVKSIGAQANYNAVLSFTRGCPACGGITDKSEKKTKGKKKTIAINTTYLYDRILRALDSDAEDKIRNILKSLTGIILTIGTGGSYSSAVFVSKLLNEYQSNTYSMPCHPRDFMFEKLDKVSTVILFSYSGKTNDIISVYRLCKQNNINVFVITKMAYDQASEYYDVNDVISYSDSIINSKERGFISMAGTLIPMVLFGKLFFDERVESFETYLKGCFENRSSFSYDKLFEINPHCNKLTIDIFSGADTKCAGHDLESKIIESGIGRAIIHEKKDFSHGRFNVLQECPPDLVVYLNNCEGSYSKKLKKYLLKRTELICLTLDSKFGNIWGDFDLTIAIQFLAKALSNYMNYDMSRPNYPKDAMHLYRYHNDDIL